MRCKTLTPATEKERPLVFAMGRVRDLELENAALRKDMAFIQTWASIGLNSPRRSERDSMFEWIIGRCTGKTKGGSVGDLIARATAGRLVRRRPVRR